jgi:gamma-glutamyltranspeptidase / glutathione hydrolase
MRYSRTLFFGVALIFLAMTPLDAQKSRNVYPLGRSQARSMVITRGGIVAASQTLAAQAGAQILARGGSAADAAIAANAVEGVVEPMMNGMGGDLFAIEWDAKTGKLTGLNSSGWAPQKLTIDFLKKKGFDKMPQTGIYSVTVPGCVAGWWALHQRFGRLPWSEILQPAIYYARHGFPVTEVIDAAWQLNQKKLEADLNARRVFLVNGQPPKVGQIFSNPEYAHALELLASQGESVFYLGAIAKAILKTSGRMGGVMTAEDLADFKPEWVRPISTTYHGWKVYELPPNGQGMGALEMLNIMGHFPLAHWGFESPQSWYVKMEAQKLAYADLGRYNGDPRFSKIPVEGIISKSYAAERAATIDMNRAHCDVAPGDPSRFNSDTIYLTAVDKDGNIVSLIQSLYDEFGSGIVVDHFGITLQDRGALFRLDPHHPDALAPHKRPYHTIIPAFMEKGSAHIGFGIMGGLNQAQAHAQFASNIADFGMNIQSALEAPRFTNYSFGGCHFLIEDRVPASVRQFLIEKGDTLEVLGRYSPMVGGGQAVLHDSATGVNYGASSPRKDGAAIPEPAPYFNSPSGMRH